MSAWTSRGLWILLAAIAALAHLPASASDGKGTEAMEAVKPGEHGPQVKQPKSSATPLPRGFVRLSEIAPGIIEDMRYATTRNFTGNPIPGYRAGRCILARPVADALARVHRAASKEGFAVKVYDCYRPVRAVNAFVRWAEAKTTAPAPFYHPRIARNRIMPLGYIARHSSHSRGTAVDLTLVRLSKEGPTPAGSTAHGGQAKSNARESASCLSPGAEPGAQTDSEPDGSIDMGTTWDCFDVRSHTLSSEISTSARANRQRLLRVMQAEGFRNYRREWWHFSLNPDGFDRARDFTVE